MYSAKCAQTTVTISAANSSRRLPLPNVSVRITDPDTMAELPREKIEIIEVHGPNVFKGYWRMPDKTASELRAHCWPRKGSDYFGWIQRLSERGCKTLRMFLSKIEQQYGKARRVWVMDHGVPTEVVLAEMRNSDPPVQYLVGTPKGRLNRLEKHLLEKPWQEAREGVKVKLLAQEGELYVFAQSSDRVSKERAMRRRQLKWCGSGSGKAPPWKSRAKNC